MSCSHDGRFFIRFLFFAHIQKQYEPRQLNYLFISPQMPRKKACTKLQLYRNLADQFIQEIRDGMIEEATEDLTNFQQKLNQQKSRNLKLKGFSYAYSKLRRMHQLSLAYQILINGVIPNSERWQQPDHLKIAIYFSIILGKIHDTDPHIEALKKLQPQWNYLPFFTAVHRFKQDNVLEGVSLIEQVIDKDFMVEQPRVLLHSGSLMMSKLSNFKMRLLPNILKCFKQVKKSLIENKNNQEVLSQLLGARHFDIISDLVRKLHLFIEFVLRQCQKELTIHSQIRLDILKLMGMGIEGFVLASKKRKPQVIERLTIDFISWQTFMRTNPNALTYTHSGKDNLDEENQRIN